MNLGKLWAMNGHRLPVTGSLVNARFAGAASGLRVLLFRRLAAFWMTRNPLKPKVVWCVLLGAFSVFAQPVALLPASEPLVVTNRDVFKEMVLPPQKVERASRWQNLHGDILDCRSNILVVRTFVLKNIYGPVPPSRLPNIGNSASHLYDPPTLRPVIGQKKISGPVVALRNCHDFAAVTNGQEIVCRALMSGTYSWEALLVELYNCAPPGTKVQP